MALLRRARREDRRHGAVHVEDEEAAIGVDASRDRKGLRPGNMIVAAMQASPFRDIDLEPGRGEMPARDVDL